MDSKVVENEIKWHTEHVVGSWKPKKIDDAELYKYKTCEDWRINPKQRMFKEMNDLAGKVVMDFGSGQGLNGVQMALLGAKVHGFDVVPGLVKESNLLARLNGVEDHCQFTVAEASAYNLGDEIYDIVLVDNVMHHIPREEFGNILNRIRCATKKGGKIIMREPIELVGVFTKIKKMFSIGVAISPDEHELSLDDLKIITSKLDNSRVYYYGLTARLAKFLGSDSIHNMAMKFDHFILNLLSPLQKWAAVIIIVSQRTS